jgi:two-component system NtrC family sensor kinase
MQSSCTGAPGAPAGGVRRLSIPLPAPRWLLLTRPERPASALARTLARFAGSLHVAGIDDAECALARCREAGVELVIVDLDPGEERERWLELLRREGRPALVAGSSAAGAARRLHDPAPYDDEILQNMNSALLVIDADGRITACNPPAEQILGERAAALRGRPVRRWFAGAPPDEDWIGRSLAQGVRFRGAESTITRSDGRLVPVGISCAPVVDAEGARIGVVATFQDLSEIKQLQRQVLQAEKMASIGQLAAGVAHEINNPMGFVHANLFQMAEYAADLRRVFAELHELRRALARGGPAEAREAAARLDAVAEEVQLDHLVEDLAKAIRESQEGSERIRHIVQDLRDFSHVDTAERVLADVNQCLDSTANIVWPMLKHLVVLEKEYQQIPCVFCYPMQLKQVFMNLLVNAFQAIEERLAGTGGTGRVRLRTELRDGGVVVTVSDSGIGIPPENLGRIFDPFFTTKKVGAGTGLGLSTSYSIVSRHGGTIAVESEVGRGSTFRVMLPVGEDTAAHDAA